MKNVAKALTYIPRVRRYIIILTTLNLIAAGVGALQPYAFKLIVDSLTHSSFSSEEIFSQIGYALSFLLAIRLLTTTFNYFNQIHSSNIFQNIVTGLRNSIFARITTLSIEYFEKERLGAISQRYTGATTDVARWVYTSLSNLLPLIASVVIILIILFFTNFWVGLISFVAITLFFATQIPTLKRVRPLMEQAQKELETASAYFNETVGHIATVRAFGGEATALDNQNQALKRRQKLIATRERKLQLSIAVRQLIYTVTIIAGIAIIAYGVTTGQHTPGDVVLVALYLQQIQSSLWPIGRMLIDTSEVDTSAERIVKMLETKQTVIDSSDAEQLESITTLEFKNVTFSYPGKETKVLDAISFKIEPGQTFALVGRSGVGKTTITKLLLRFYEPTEGEILINGQPIQAFTQESVRKHIGVVMQDVALFNDTIEANLQLAKPRALKSEVKTAAIQAHADVFIDKLPDKYKTLVGERGVKLSGGEKQRVAIARAILKNPELIILDEATSALDSQSEQHVQAGLKQLMNGRTAIVIAHRLSTVMNADQILVIEHGRITEQGTHSELLASDSGIYAKLFKLQAGALAAV